MPLNKKIALVAFDRQVSGKGTLAATAKFGFGLRDGTVLSVDMTQDYEEMTISDRFPPSAYRSAFQHGADLTTRAWAKSVGLLLFAALGNDVVTGAGDPFTHTLTPAATPLYLTLFSRLDTEYHKVRDCRISELSFSWDGAAPVEMGLQVLGTVGAFYQGSWTATNDESTDQFFYPAGGTFQVDTSSGTPVTADITGGTITISNHLDPVQLSRALEPDDMWPGLHEITVSLKLIPTDTDLWQKIITGTGAATIISNAPVYGSFNTKFISQAAPERSLALTAPRIAFTGDYPDADPAGGPVEIELTGTVVKASAGANFTALVLNDQNATAYNGS